MILSTLVYVRRDGHTLMLHKRRGHQRGKWNGLGGKFDAGETPEACAHREVREESGLEAGTLDLRGFLTFPLFDGTRDWYVFVFLCRDARGQPVASDEGDLRWVPDGELPALPLHEGDRVFLPWLDRNAFFSARFWYQQGDFQGYEAHFYEAGGMRHERGDASAASVASRDARAS